MATKLEKDTFPAGTTADDFKCFGPCATKDGEFGNVKIADLGCFTQDGKDSNKGYHAAVVQHKNSGRWYTYFTWGRTGAQKWSFQFVECDSESEAQEEFVAQVMSKNVKRGEWTNIGGIRTLRAKPGKDVYLVRPLSIRSVGLPDAKTIKINDGSKLPSNADSGNGKSQKTAKNSKPARQCDPQTAKLLSDLSVATVEYTRGNMADKSLPTQAAIDEARTLLTEAEKLVAKIGNDVQSQVNSGDLKQVTYALFGRIPKVKPVGAAEHTWILSQDNIFRWRQDLDAYESALYSEVQLSEPQQDPYGGMSLDMSWIDPKSDTGRFLYDWWPRATQNRHGYLGSMKIRNIWRVDRHDDRGKLERVAKDLANHRLRIDERPLHQIRRPDVDADLAKIYWDSNTALLFHGTRSVNVSSILRKALMLPKQLVGVVITGAMFGPGLYWADDWKKSAGYTSLRNSYWSNGSGSIRGRSAFMFAGEVVLGEAFVAPGPHGYTLPPHGKHSVMGKANHSGVANNEWIIFDTQQNRLRYLAEFDV